MARAVVFAFAFVVAFAFAAAVAFVFVSAVAFCGNSGICRHLQTVAAAVAFAGICIEQQW